MNRLLVLDFNSWLKRIKTDEPFKFDIISGGFGAFKLAEPTKIDNGWSAPILVSSELDYETRNTYDISVVVTDSPINGRLLDSQASLTIKIIDVDDNPPQLASSKQNISISIDETADGVIFSIEASDILDRDTIPRTPDNFRVKIETIQPSKFYRYLTERSTADGGWAIFAENLDGFGDDEIEVTLKVFSPSKVDLFTVSTVVFKIVDVNNNYPRLTYKTAQGSEIWEGISSKNVLEVDFTENDVSSIIQLNYDDLDKNDNAKVVFSVDNQNIDYQTFERASGNRLVLSFKQPPDFEGMLVEQTVVIEFMCTNLACFSITVKLGFKD